MSHAKKNYQVAPVARSGKWAISLPNDPTAAAPGVRAKEGGLLGRGSETGHLAAVLDHADLRGSCHWPMDAEQRLSSGHGVEWSGVEWKSPKTSEMFEKHLLSLAPRSNNV